MGKSEMINRSWGMAVAFFFVIGAGPLRAADLAADAWPQFKRDARRTGDNPGAALELPLQRITAIRFPAPIYASPAVLGGRVYIQDARGNVACIDARKNQVLWTTPIGGINNSSSPAVADGKVYVGSTAGHFYVLDAATGKVLKQIPAPGGVLTAPAVANGAIYFSTFDAELTKIDPSGNVVWTFDGGRISITEFAVRDREILFFAGTSITTLYRLHDDGEQFRVVGKTPAPSNCCPVGGPVLTEAGAFAFPSFDSEFGRFYLFQDGGKTGVGTDVNDSRITPSVRGDRLYRGDKCYTLGAALKPIWRTDPAELYDGGFHSSPALARDFLVIGSEMGRVHFLPLEGDARVRKPAWQFAAVGAGQPNGAVSSSPAVVAGMVFFGGEDGVLYGLGQGKEAAIVDLPATGALPPAPPRLQGSEWVTPGGDMGYSFVSADTVVKPPFAVAWKTRVWSTFKCPMIVADGKVFGGGRMGPLTALDAATGAILWKTHHPGVESRPAPTYADGKLLMLRARAAQGDSPYISGASSGPHGEGLWCHDAATGKVLWHVPMSSKYHFNHDGLAVHAGKVFVDQIDDKGVVHVAAHAIDTGREVWRRPLDELPPKKLRLPPRFAGVIAAGLWCVSVSDQGTLALDPATGKTVWSNRELFISNRCRIAARNGTLLVFTPKGDHALDARTGTLLWTGAATATPYVQALTDRYLDSKGRQGVYPPATCAWPVFANGHWYVHNSFAKAHGANRMVSLKEADVTGDEVLSPKLTVWGYDFLSNACPSPSPAYGRLYYSPNAEGVIYCFAPTADQSPQR
jgi:outer membrane protein assembly factor BamB